MLLVVVYPRAKSEEDFLQDWAFFFNEYVCCNTPLAIAIEQESRVEQSFGVASLLLPGYSWSNLKHAGVKDSAES
jgi:hypothetical protein